MTQKELDYVEDAIKHESNLVSILSSSMEMLIDEDLVKFVSKELDNHQKLHKKIMKLLEDAANE